MGTRLIERQDWRAFFDAFSRAHDGWLVTLEVLDPELGDQIEIENLPLRGITMNRDGSLEFTFDNGRNHVSHTLNEPTRVFSKQSRQDVDEVLEFEGAQQTTLLLFRSPMASIEVDGVEDR